MTDFNIEAELARLSRSDRYFLRAEWSERWEEVSQQTFIGAERAAGFRPKSGSGVATGGFSNNQVTGRVVSFKPDGTLYSDHYQQHEPEFYALLVGESNG